MSDFRSVLPLSYCNCFCLHRPKGLEQVCCTCHRSECVCVFKCFACHWRAEQVRKLEYVSVSLLCLKILSEETFGLHLLSSIHIGAFIFPVLELRRESYFSSSSPIPSQFFPCFLFFPIPVFPMDVPSNLPIFHLVFLFFSSRITGVISLIFFPSSIYFSLCPHCLLFCSLSLSQRWSHFQDVRDAECHTHLYGWMWLLKGDNGTHPDVSPLVVWAL